MTAALHLIARIAGRAVAFAADQVDSVVDLGPVTPVPLAAPGVVGLAALRSRVLTVVDPRVGLGLGDLGGKPERAVVTLIDGHVYAILVEALEDVAEYHTLPLPPGIALEGGWADAGQSLIDRPGEPVLVVDLSRLAPQPAAIAA
jgi:purine-binding chemotaxis protein CheW